MSRYLQLIVLWMVSLHSFAENPQLEIVVSNISEAQGTLFVTIYDNPENWLGESAYRDLRFPVTSMEDNTILIEDLPAGTYAISIFHDLNGNLDIDTNFIGIPKEPYGFSGEMGRFGPPKFNKASFVLDEDKKLLAIKLE